MNLGPLGMSGGMDINSMVNKIVDSERIPKQMRIDNERARNDASISAYGRLRESLDTMKNLMANFRQEKAFAVRTVDTTDDKVVSATATTDAIAGKYAIDVLQLAQSHKVASDAIAEDTEFGPGKLQISLGEESFDVHVGSRSDLMDVVRGINSSRSNPGVRASIINDTEGPRLIVASNLSGKENQISIHVDAESDSGLKQFEYKTLEQRVKALEEARLAAQEILSKPAPGEEVPSEELKDSVDPDVALDDQGKPKLDENGNPIPVDPQVANAESTDTPTPTDQEKTESTEPQASSDPSAQDTPDLSYGEQAAVDAQAELDEIAALAGMMPQDSISGWTETASGTLMDSYHRAEPELDEAAIEKAPDVPGWNNTASGTLTDSYVTPKEAQAKLEEEQRRIEEEAAQEKAELDEKVAKGEITPEQAKEIERARLTPEERAYQDEVEQAQEQLAKAQASYDTYDGMTEVQEGQDSIVVLDGVAQLSSDNNVIENAIDGIDLTVKGVTPEDSAPAEIGVEYDRRSVRDDIEAFVSAYNQFYQTSKALSGVDPSTGQKGPLSGDSTVRNADARLKSLFSSQIEKAPEDLKSLTEFGITTTRQGTLEINYNMLDRQLNNNFDKLGEFFGGNRGFARSVEEAVNGITGIGGSIRTREQSLTESNYRLQDDQAALDRRMDSLQQRTQAKFSAMQDATGKMQGQLGALMSALG